MTAWEYLEVFADTVQARRWLDNTGRTGELGREASGYDFYASLLDQFGQEGWELVSVMGEGAMAGSYRFFFKRPRQGLR